MTSRAMARAAMATLLAIAAPNAFPDEPPAEVQPRFLWGVLVRYAAGEAFSAFSQWVMTKLSEQPGSAKPSVEHLRLAADTTGGAVIMRNPAMASTTSRQAGPVTLTAPSEPIVVEARGPNYQGVHIAIIGAGRDGVITDVRSIGGGFRTGERFKLRVISTFGGALVIDNVTPKGEQHQIYPPQREYVVMLQPGADTLLPLPKDQFFEFTRTAGDERIVVYLRDARAVGSAASRAPVHRKDEEYGTHFMQAVAAGSFAAISDSIRVQHH